MFDDVQAELAALREELAKFDDAMRAIACNLGAGGYNAEFLSADQLASKVQWGVDNLLRVEQQRLADAERRNAVLDAHLSKATDFVGRLCDSAGNQPSVATGYLRDILDTLKPTTAAEFLAAHPAQEMSAYDAVMSDEWMPPEGVSAETVYATLSKDPNKSRRTSPENVSDVLETLSQMSALKPTESGASE
jgi:hypothetical protein